MIILLDLLLGFAALSAAVYCLILSRRLRALTRIDGSLGGAVAVLSAQVDALTEALDTARDASDSLRSDLRGQTAEASSAARRLELLLASLHDLPGLQDGAHPHPAATADALPSASVPERTHGAAPAGRGPARAPRSGSGTVGPTDARGAAFADRAAGAGMDPDAVLRGGSGSGRTRAGGAGGAGDAAPLPAHAGHGASGAAAVPSAVAPRPAGTQAFWRDPDGMTSHAPLARAVAPAYAAPGSEPAAVSPPAGRSRILRRARHAGAGGSA